MMCSKTVRSTTIFFVTVLTTLTACDPGIVIVRAPRQQTVLPGEDFRNLEFELSHYQTLSLKRLVSDPSILTEDETTVSAVSTDGLTLTFKVRRVAVGPAANQQLTTLHVWEVDDPKALQAQLPYSAHEQDFQFSAGDYRNENPVAFSQIDFEVFGFDGLTGAMGTGGGVPSLMGSMSPFAPPQDQEGQVLESSSLVEGFFATVTQ